VNRKLNPYSIGEIPIFNPCDKCIIQVNCSELCDDKLRWQMKNKKIPPIKIKLKQRKRKYENTCLDFG